MLLMMTVSTPGWAKIIQVNPDTPYLNGYIRLANEGDEIIVPPGIYRGPINIAKSLNIHSTDPANWEVVDSTIIEGDPQTYQPVVDLRSSSGKTIRLAGFTIRNGGGGGVVSVIDGTRLFGDRELPYPRQLGRPARLCRPRRQFPPAPGGG